MIQKNFLARVLYVDDERKEQLKEQTKDMFVPVSSQLYSGKKTCFIQPATCIACGGVVLKNVLEFIDHVIQDEHFQKV